MCPLCNDCDYWQLDDICLFKKIAYLFDHPGTVFYAIFMSFWGKNEKDDHMTQKITFKSHRLHIGTEVHSSSQQFEAYGTAL